MAFRFQKRIRLFPGVTINIGKRGFSTSIGPRGAKLTVRPDGSHQTTIGIPGTGASWTSISHAGQPAAARDQSPVRPTPSTITRTVGNLLILLFTVAMVALVARIVWHTFKEY
jgi:hypothetical protein